MNPEEIRQDWIWDRWVQQAPALPTTDAEVKRTIADTFKCDVAEWLQMGSSMEQVLALAIWGLYKCARGEGMSVTEAYKDALKRAAGVKT